MVFSRYTLTIGIFIIAIAITSIGLGIFLQKPDLPYTTSLFVILLIAETVALFIYLGKIRRDLLRLISALRNEDPTLQFRKDSTDPYFSEIHKGFNEIIRDFRLIRAEKEIEHQFFKATIDHIQFGLLAFDEDGGIEMVNSAFLKLFNLEGITHIDSLGSVSQELPEIISGLGNLQETLRKIHMNEQIHHLIFLASQFRLNQKKITLVSIRDISREIDKNELEAWQKLMRILRHEILNSLSPVKLISSSLVQTIQPEGINVPSEELSKSDLETIHTGLKTIHNRVQGLSQFMEAYSNLYQIPEPIFENIKVEDLLNKVSKLFQDQFKKENIHFSITYPANETNLTIDSKLIEQVLINLVKNAIEATRLNKKKTIRLAGKSSENEFIISISDNGCGIPKNQMESIFVPFYSTREKGSGIGLSFSQHVMRLHNGHLIALSSPKAGSKFQLIFRENINKDSIED